MNQMKDYYFKIQELYGMSFSDINSYRYKQNNLEIAKNFEEFKDSMIGIIGFGINKSNFDNYKRSYQKLQSLLAEIMSVINLLLEIGRQMSNILCNKKMSLKIIEYLINKNSLHSKKIINKIKLNNNKSNESSIRKVESEIFSNSNKNLENSISNKKVKMELNNNKISKNNDFDKKSDKIKIFKKINYLHILKSFLCFKDKKSQFINYCDNIIRQDISVERMLEKFYNIEKLYYYLSNKDKRKIKYIKNKKCLEIDKKISEINGK